jgi:tetratricopeptide (TPR) repeat protein
VLTIVFAALAPEMLCGQESRELNRLYSEGVNAFFAGRSSEAESSLSQALAIDSQDPRLYYFRALSLLRLGRVDEARGDMQVGASLEAQHPQRFTVGKALERVQGSHRLMLERYRREARSQQVALNPAQPIQPIQPIRRQPPPVISRDQHVLRQRIVIPLDRLLAAGPPQPLSPEELSRRAQQARAARITPPQPAGETVQPASTDDPFRDDPTRPAPSAPATPAASETGTPVESKVAEAAEAEDMPASETEADQTPESDENPFGDLDL